MSKIAKAVVAVAALVTLAACAQRVSEDVVVIDPIVAEPITAKF